MLLILMGSKTDELRARGHTAWASPLLRVATLHGTEVITVGYWEDYQKDYLTLPWLLSGSGPRGQVGRQGLGQEESVREGLAKKLTEMMRIHLEHLPWRLWVEQHPPLDSASVWLAPGHP